MFFDPLGIVNVFATLLRAWLQHPQRLSEAQREYFMNTFMLDFNAFAYALGGLPAPCAKAVRSDERFSDAIWTNNPLNCVILQSYLTYTRWLERSIYDTPGVSKKERRTGAFWARQWFNAFAPTNFYFTNPSAIEKAWKSGGASLRNGITNFISDLNVQDIRMTQTKPFQVGRNLAATPGNVVFRNHVMEVIHYRPMRNQVHAIPIVMVPPWINKYYILDLNEKKSMVRYLLSEGFDVFMISWKNPDATMANYSFDTYVFDGILNAITTAQRICNAPQVHAVGYCIGGTALSTLMGWLNKKYKDPMQIPVAHWTVLSSLIDFSRPGEIEAFINEQSLATLETLMANQGYLDKQQIAWAFRMLRPNSLVWHYVVHHYLYGETPSSFDVLYWNTDSTRLPFALHRFCLRELYMDNKLARRNGIRLNGQTIDMVMVQQPLYAVGTDEDHITPWRGTFRSLSLINSPARYVLSTSGHILGIINPPSSTSSRRYWAGEATGEIDHKAWYSRQTMHPGSWWPDWSAWLHERCGPLVTPPAIHPDYPPLCDAPGTYVLEQ